MRLRDLLNNCLYEEISPTESILDSEISSITYDSRRASKDSLFVAIKGENHDGRDFIFDAIKKGSKGIVLEDNTEPMEGFITDGLFVIKVRDARKALACLSNNFFGRPSERLNIIGVTGTNGKTTTTFLIKTIIETWGRPTGLIGTISYSIRDRHHPAIHTTPEAIEFQSLLKEMLLSGCNYVVAEVSSHALKQKRVDYTRFSTAVFTNLTRDHLDFHRTMEDYYLSKRRLFTELLIKNGTAVINRDDDWGKRLLSELSDLRPDLRIITYGLEGGATIFPSVIERSSKGTSLVVKVSEREICLDSPLIGLPNIYNILSAFSVALNLGIPDEIIRDGLNKNTVVRGRFEKVEVGQDFLCIIDYAHTPDALKRLISTTREIVPKGRIVTVFGCGGNRDKGKRPIMGQIATELSDFVIVTSDNPRNEDPEVIISDIISGVTKDNYEIVPDRAEAIKRAISIARRGDAIVIAGKGHEDYQEIRGKRERFSDRDVFINALRAMGIPLSER